MKESFFILLRQNSHNERDIIQEYSSGLKVSVFDLDDGLFNPTPNEINYLGETSAKELVFETIGYKGETQALILTMISKYALYIEEPEMKLCGLGNCA